MTEAPEKIFLAVEGGEIDPFWYGEKPDKPSQVIQDVEYHRADLPPKVKALEWVKTAVGYKAKAFGNSYEIERRPDVCLWWTPTSKWDDGKYAKSFSHAKAAAQAHYEALVLSYLEVE